ncbi:MULTISPECIES: type II toxin-antitoxin system prevent-host-death family antitoxin [Roseateles]|uniref:Antitoxin n=1 Tax=Pelomonas caseinilytica TaxID=2906763 RepID=A0ABS8XCB0_9BURK|nr:MULTISPECIES: type II toxin-antitoxin system prevent-host-death family antitoxin [unclassified Roseateles]MCE4536203.1 type II toxin-antitoxin system prevent-host-death family antitoxin [Pelomonas sp. P7]HEV6968725.1 type II toxin-antitoxin system prevent-host-death family antitoxin [Roseateles sp.]
MAALPDAALTDPLPSVSATQLVAGIQKVGRAVAAHGAVLITKHDQPAFVLMSVERYRELQRAAEPDLGALGSEFDAMLARMQGQGGALAEAFAMAPEAVAAAAVRAARPARRKAA